MQAPTPIKRRVVLIAIEFQKKREKAEDMIRHVIVCLKENDDASEIKRPDNKEIIRGQYFEPPNNKQALPRIRNMNGAIKSADEG